MEKTTHLVESGFIAYIPMGKDSVYKLVDEYSHFYLKFMTSRIPSGSSIWLKKSAGSSWKSWSGFAFENICL